MKVVRLLFLLGLLSSISCCDWLRHATRLSEEALRSLKLMVRRAPGSGGPQGRPLTVEDCPASFPHQMYSRVHQLQVQSQLFFIKENLQMLSGVYLRGNDSRENDSKTTAFLQILEVQSFELNQCISSETAKKGRYQNASWDRTRCETKVQLQRLHILLTAMTAPAGTH
ncbi:interferon a3-like [Neosynchiropus ocellatus]